MARIIESPGVQISEIDLSRNPTLPTGTKVFLAGFAPQGPADEIIQVSSIGEFTQIYGQPQTPAERYFYHSAAPLFNTQAQVFTYRFPYGYGSGNGFGNYFSALVYPTTAVNIDWPALSGSPSLSATYGSFLGTYNAQTSGVMYLIGKPTHFDLTQDQYNNIVQGSGGFNWSSTPAVSFNANLSSFGSAGFIVLNKSQATINNNYEGYYLGLTDNSHLDPALDSTDLQSVQTVTSVVTSTGITNYLTVPTTRLNFALTSISDNHPVSIGLYGDHGVSVSEVIENVPTFNIDTSTWDDTAIVGLFKLRQSVFAPDTIKLDYTLSEKYVGSFDYWRQINTQNGGQPTSFFLETKEDQSPNITMLINPFISHKNGTTWLNLLGNPTNKVRVIDASYSNSATLLFAASAKYGITNPNTAYTQINLLSGALYTAYNGIGAADSLFALGSYQSSNNQTKDLGSITQKLDRMFNIAENSELYDFDISLDAGMSTIFAVSQYLNNTPAYTLSGQNIRYFDDTIFVTAISGLAVTNPEEISSEGRTFSNNYQAITNKYSSFAGLKRQDHLYIADLPRNIFVQGTNGITLDNDLNNFSLNIYSPIRNCLSNLNTSYACTYANWVKVFDNVLDDFCWVPFSGQAAAAMANTDTLYQPWYAPAGFIRGSVTDGVVQLALTPKQKQRDQLYKISVNPVTFFPNEGNVIYGQKTLLKQPSAFDRINVRRLFLNLEKATNQTVKYFVFEPNTLLTRTRVVNTLTPIFENAKNTEGLYDYLIVCDERNNTPDVIDQNELVVDIYLKPVRTAEFILVNFYATRTSANFQELVS